jgi:hypothetical protein
VKKRVPIAEWRRTAVKAVRRKPVPVRCLDDGREICNRKTSAGKTEYLRRTYEMAIRQGWLCGMCGELMTLDDVSFDHQDLRSGGRQDDRIEVNGVWQNAALHIWCNTQKGSRRIPYLKHAVNRPVLGQER